LVEVTNLNFEALSGLDKILVKAIEKFCWSENLLLNIEDCITGNGGDFIDYLGLEQ
jgi:hypothetical protein